MAAQKGDEGFHARDGDEACGRLVVHHGQPVGGMYVSLPDSAKAFTTLQQQPVDIGPIRATWRAGQLDVLKQPSRG